MHKIWYKFYKPKDVNIAQRINMKFIGSSRLNNDLISLILSR